MWGTIVAFTDYVISNHLEFFLGGVAWLWHHISSSKTSWIEDKVSEVATAAWNLAMAASTELHVPLPVMLGRAKDLAHQKLAKLSIPLSQTVIALVDHALDMIAGQAAAAGLPTEVAEMADDAIDVKRVWSEAAKAGAAAVAGIPPGLVETTIVPADPCGAACGIPDSSTKPDTPGGAGAGSAPPQPATVGAPTP